MPRTKTKRKKFKKIKLKKSVFRKKTKSNKKNNNKVEQANTSSVSKNIDQKIEITKIKKQATEKRLYKIKVL